MQNVNNKFTTISKEKNSIRFLGILMGKYYYNSLMWSIVVGYLLYCWYSLCCLEEVMCHSSTKQMLAEAKDEFETHRKRARERKKN